jgi:hypothetical protein
MIRIVTTIRISRYTVLSPPVSSAIRHGFCASLINMNATGRPPNPAASTRSGLPLSGHVPVHAARVSDAARNVHTGSAA